MCPAALELAQGADAIVEELEGFDELVGRDFQDPVVGEEVGILGVAERVRE